MATEADKIQLEDAVDASWMALASGADPRGREGEKETLLSWSKWKEKEVGGEQYRRVEQKRRRRQFSWEEAGRRERRGEEWGEEGGH